MKSMMTIDKALLLAATAMLAACASTGGQTGLKLEAPKPTYTEKVPAVSLHSFKAAAACPADKKYESQDWRKVVSMANACVKAGDWNKVEAIGDHLAVKAHLTPWGAYFLSLAAESRKDYPRATWMLELALKKAPNEGIFHYQLGRLLWQQGEDVPALKELQQASELNPSLIEAHYVMGQMALQKDNTSEAERLFKKVLSVDNRHQGANLALGALYIKSQDWGKAESALETAIRLNPRASRPRLALAHVQEQHLKKQVEALSTYREIRSLAQGKKLDEAVTMNLDEKIKQLEKSTTKVVKENQASARTPSAAEGQVAK